MTPEEFLAGVERLADGDPTRPVLAAPSDLAKLTTALRSVLALHRQSIGPDRCLHCRVPAPCPTVTAITDALTDTP